MRVGKLTPLRAASAASSLLAAVWSFTMRAPKFLTSAFEACCSASLPSSISARPPFEAVCRNVLSAVAPCFPAVSAARPDVAIIVRAPTATHMASTVRTLRVARVDWYRDGSFGVVCIALFLLTRTAARAVPALCSPPGMTFALESDYASRRAAADKPTLEESMDAIEMLTNDHNKVRELFKAFKGGGGVTGLLRRTVGDVTGAERLRVVEQGCNELEVHTLIEEEIFYPAVRALGDRELMKQVNEALKEHARVKNEVASIREQHGDIDTLEDTLEQRMTALEEDVEHHATEEEDELFPRLDEIMPENERRELARRMQALKEEAAAPPPGVATGAPRGRAGARR